jgi:hypothetical protein
MLRGIAVGVRITFFVVKRAGRTILALEDGRIYLVVEPSRLTDETLGGSGWHEFADVTRLAIGGTA